MPKTKKNIELPNMVDDRDTLNRSERQKKINEACFIYPVRPKLAGAGVGASGESGSHEYTRNKRKCSTYGGR